MGKSLFSLVTAAVLGAAGLFHTELKSSWPAKDASVSTAPAKVSLTFTGGVNAGASAIALLAADSAEVEKLTVKSTADAATIDAAVTKPLAPGRYIVRYRTASSDGHAVRGAYAFTLTSK